MGSLPRIKHTSGPEDLEFQDSIIHICALACSPRRRYLGRGLHSALSKDWDENIQEAGH